MNDEKTFRLLDRIEAFGQFWNLYDKKIGKMMALVAWKKLSDDDISAVLNVVENYVRSTPEKRYRPHASTFLNQRRWEDDINDVWAVNRKIDKNSERENNFQIAMNEKLKQINDENRQQPRIEYE